MTSLHPPMVIPDTVAEKSILQHVDNVPVEDGPPSITKQTILACIALSLSYNGYLFTLLMPAAVLSYINADLGPDSRYPWITITWNLGAAVIVTVGGRLTDIFGRRWFMITGTIFGAIGALVGATGKSVPVMIGAGIIMGIGGGFQEIVFACVQEIVPNRYRFFTLGCLELSNICALFSPLFGYAFITYSPISWRACYWWMFSFECAAAAALYFFYRPPSFETKHSEDVGGLVLLLLGLNRGGRDEPWKSAGVIAPIVLSVPMFAVLVLWETYRPLKNPILPIHIFKKWRHFSSLVAVTFIGGMLYYSLNILWPRQSAALFIPPNEPIIRGVYANMFNFGTILGGIIVLTIVPKAGHERWQLVGFLVIQTAMIGSMSTVGVNDKAQAIASVIIISMNITPPLYLVYGMSSLNLEDQTDIGVSQGIISTSRLIGGAVATAVYTAIQASRYKDVIGPMVAEAAQESGFTGSIPKLVQATTNGTRAAYQALGATNATIAAVQAAVKEANVKSFSLIYKVAVAFGGLAILIALTTKTIEKSKKSNDKAVLLENEKPKENGKSAV